MMISEISGGGIKTKAFVCVRWSNWWRADLVWQDDSRASTDAHDRHGRLSGDEVQDLRHGLWAHVVLEHHAMDTVGGESVADAG